MAQYFTYANFISCTNLVDFQNPTTNRHKISLKFELLPSSFIPNKIEIYRYVGPYMQTVCPYSINETNANSFKICEVTQLLSNNKCIGSSIGQIFFPSTIPGTTISSDLTALSTFVDDFSNLSSTGLNLRYKHNLNESDPGGADNFNVINDIGFTRRTLFYIIKTYIQGSTCRDIIYPDTSEPQLTVHLSAVQSAPYQETRPDCYPWSHILSSTSGDALTGYDDLSVTYRISSNMGSYLLTGIRLDVNDFISPYHGDLNNLQSINLSANLTYNTQNEYAKLVNVDYTYHSPSKSGTYDIRSNTSNNLINVRPGGTFNIKAVSYVKNLYNDTTYTPTATGQVCVLERWPEPRFLLEGHDVIADRYSLFCGPTAGMDDRYDKSDSIVRESNSNVSLRYDVLYGVDPLSATILDNTIARSWPISSWNVTISTNNLRLPWQTLNFVLTSNTGLEALQDQQNLFDYISSRQLRYGDYEITMTVIPEAVDYIGYVPPSDPTPTPTICPVPWSVCTPPFMSLNTYMYFFVDNSSTGNLMSILNVINGELKNQLIGFYGSESAYNAKVKVVYNNTERALNWLQLQRSNWATHGSSFTIPTITPPDPAISNYISFTFCQESLGNTGPGSYHMGDGTPILGSSGNPVRGTDAASTSFTEKPLNIPYVGPMYSGVPAHFKGDVTALRDWYDSHELLYSSYAKGVMFGYNLDSTTAGYLGVATNVYSNYLKRLFGELGTWAADNPNYSLVNYSDKIYRKYNLSPAASAKTTYNNIREALSHFGLDIAEWK